MLGVVRYLHLVSAFTWFAAVFAAHWNALQARRATGWPARSTLFAVNRTLSTMIALPALLGLGLVGNFLAVQSGYRMAGTPMLVLVNVLWLVLLVMALAFEMPAAGALGALAHAAQDAAARGGEGEPAGWGRELGRWRMANGVQLALFVVLLALMVAPWGAAPR